MSTEKLVLGIDLGGTSLKWGIVSSSGEIFKSGREELPDRLPETVVKLIAGIITKAQSNSESLINAIGIGTPGLVDKTRRIVRTSPNFAEWNNLNLVEIIENESDNIPIVLENDANLLVLSETRWGRAKGINNLIVLTLGTGVGGGILADGKMIRGSGGGGAELGHIPVDVTGPACGCGALGCLETFCNIKGVMRAAEEIYKPENPPADPLALTIAAEKGDQKAIKTWADVGNYLGIGLAALINIFNPEKILIGGGVAGAGVFLLEPARKTAKARCYSHNWEEVTIEQAGKGEQSGLLGAAALAFDSL